ncbi:helix-turn-helix domain-containing protein [Halegenticoccus tardaugens]|uniref:helix-turn-helix domain-containing protein n=1 Tax=Halegenticoccus tardaugens TaxID=2071624 RepID=UPI00100B7043|nr:helix-turn-helix domain-containing protein [Halegenticoccus tardaugens]
MITATLSFELPFLTESLVAVPEMRLSIELGQVLCTDRHTATLLVWASGDAFDRFEASLEEDPTVVDVAPLTTAEPTRLYRIGLPKGEFCSAVSILFGNHDTILLDGIITSAGWNLTLRTLDRSVLSDIHDEFRKQDVPVNLQSLHSEVEKRGLTAELSTEQYETLMTAFDRGYFDIPRGVTQAELAGEFGISGQALSERLRRATAAVLDDALNDSAKRRIREFYR